MGTTTTFGWEVPDDTDYVQQGYAAIDTLGQSIDTTLNVVTGSTGLGDVPKLGLTYIGTYSATGASLTIDNVFTTQFESYKVIIRGIGSATTQARLQMRTTVPATDTSANWFFGNVRVNVGGTVSSNVGNAATSFIVTDLFNARDFTATLEFQNPRLALNTFINGFSNYTANADLYFNNAFVNTTTAYGGFTLFQGSGNFTSVTAKVYGYRNS